MVASNQNTENKSPTVCILTAGRGSRMGKDLCINKALLPINGKAIISSIIEKFPIETKFIIGIGHKGKQVKDFLICAHPNTQFTFVNIQKLDGEGSGPGQSILECSEFLNKPFYFAACDIAWNDPIPLNITHSWMAVADPSPSEDLKNYCNVAVKNGFVTSFFDKETPSEKNTKIFTGLAFINEPEFFFEKLKHAVLVQSELQISAGLVGLKEKGIEAVDISWNDLGTWEKYRKEASKFESFDFSKSNEFLFFSQNNVIKFFDDTNIVKKRVEKSEINANVFPKINYTSDQFYSYPFVQGETLYEKFSLSNVERLIPWLEKNLWIKKIPENPLLANLCKDFYQIKTNDRIKQWKNKYPNFRECTYINSCKTPSLYEILNKLPWEILFKGITCFIHGDLQPDNILCTKNEFLLLDWRQDFAGNVEIGDLYYDLAKLRGGIILNYRLIKEGKFKYIEENDQCIFSLPTYDHQIDALEYLDNYIVQNNYNLQKVKLLNGLIFLNMAPLHAAPFDKLLWALAREHLAQELSHEY